MCSVQQCVATFLSIYLIFVDQTLNLQLHGCSCYAPIIVCIMQRIHARNSNNYFNETVKYFIIEVRLKCITLIEQS